MLKLWFVQASLFHRGRSWGRGIAEEGWSAGDFRMFEEQE
jgi:hypothetical protein